MTANLKLWKELAWSKDDYDIYRENYYIMLLNNAYFSHLRGASIYYAEKIKNISANGKRYRPTIELNVKVDIYILQNRFDKLALAYENEKLYFKDLVSKAKDQPQNHFLKF